ncbi:MAG TPA: hypothetical protein PLW93_02135 [Candidatus Absconditabacterales bacterium]|nr:hypothetical protein [Candidatus Absconditabacterales bacterium]HNG97049.1 hypothetical protein [Candidatus Absconditabacterales bacterium]
MVNKEQRNYLVESSMFFDLASRAAEVYIKAPNVRKQKITSIFFSNIIVDNQKRLHIAVKPLFKELFVANGAPTQCQFEHIYNNILCMPIIKSRGLFNIYINHIDIKKEKISCLSQKELVLYDIALVSQ